MKGKKFLQLRLKISEVFGTQEAFAEAMGMARTTLVKRLNGTWKWKMPEIAKACELLHIPHEEVYSFFYSES